MRRTRLFSLLGVLLLALCLTVSGVWAMWIYSTDPADVESTLAASLEQFVWEDIYIIDATVLSGTDGTVDGYSSTTLRSSVTLDGAQQVSIAVTVYNHSQKTYLYANTRQVSYDNVNVTYNVNEGKGFLDGGATLNMTVTFSTVGGTLTEQTLTSALELMFAEATGDPHTVVSDGNDADNINTLFAGNTRYDGNSTANRWTNWAADGEGLGVPATLTVLYPDEQTVNSISFYHFVDSVKPVSMEGVGSCDFPVSIDVYYLDDDGTYQLLGDYTESRNFTDAARRRGDAVYGVKFGNSNSYTYLTSTYTGEAPRTTYTLGQSITTRALKIVLTPKAQSYVGLLELEIE